MTHETQTARQGPQDRRKAPMRTPTDLGAAATRDIGATQIYAMTDPIAERIRKVGGTTLRSIGHIARLQGNPDNDADYVEPSDMLAELCQDHTTLAARLRAAHGACEEHHDVGTTSLIEAWIDETERRTWFLFEASRPGDATGH